MLKKNDSMEESYELKYKWLFASLKKQNMGSKVLLADDDGWFEEEEFFDEEVKGKDACLMETTDMPFTKDSNETSTLLKLTFQKLPVIPLLRIRIAKLCIMLITL